MRYGEGLLQDIARRTDLVQLVGKRVKLERKGRIFWGLCPFHKEKSPSFKVENERRTYHCFGCGAGGDAFKWLQDTEGLSFPESVQKLAAEAGVQLPAWSPEDEARETRKKSLYEIIALAEAFFEEQLRAPAGAAARAYVKSRGLNGDICKRFHIGYAPDSHAALKDHLTAKGVMLADMIEAGLVRAGEEGKPPRDFFFDRLMFPIADARGRTVAFGGRALSPDAKPKYINTGDTTLFAKGRLLYNFRNAREAALKGADLIVAEGYMDVIALAEAGFAGAVAPLGTALTEDQLDLLWKVAPEPVLCFDGDEAGARAARRAAKLALPRLAPGQSLKFVFLPSGEDPDSFLRAHGGEPMRQLLAKAQPLAEVLWKAETEGRDYSTPERRAGLEAELARIVAAIGDAKIADYYRRDFEERVFKAFKQRKFAPSARPRAPSRVWPGARTRPSGPEGGQEKVSSAVKRSLHAVSALSAPRQLKERELVGLLLASPSLIERHAEALAELAFTDLQLDTLKRELLNLTASGVRLERTVVENHLVRQGMGVLAERLTANLADPDADSDRVFAFAMAQLRDPDLPTHSDLSARRSAAFARYSRAGAEEDWQAVLELTAEIRKAAGKDTEK